jgi:hypothetical protein
MAREYRAGMSYSGDVAHIVVVEIVDGDARLLQVDEHFKSAQDSLWFLEGLRTIDPKILSRLSHLSISFDHSAAHFLRFPLDATLNQIDKNEQIQWEFAHLLTQEEMKDLVNDVHILRTSSRDQVADTLAVGYRRSMVFGIQRSCVDRKINLEFLDVNLFASEHALWYNHPDLRPKTVCLLDVGFNYAAASVLTNGRITDYYSAFTSTAEGVVAFVDGFIGVAEVSTIVVYGTAVTFEMVKALRAAFGNHVATLNPFRRLGISSQTRNYERYIGLEHRFVPSVGSAMRNR